MCRISETVEMRSVLWGCNRRKLSSREKLWTRLVFLANRFIGFCHRAAGQLCAPDVSPWVGPVSVPCGLQPTHGVSQAARGVDPPAGGDTGLSTQLRWSHPLPSTSSSWCRMCSFYGFTGFTKKFKMLKKIGKGFQNELMKSNSYSQLHLFLIYISPERQLNSL